MHYSPPVSIHSASMKNIVLTRINIMLHVVITTNSDADAPQQPQSIVLSPNHLPENLFLKKKVIIQRCVKQHQGSSGLQTSGIKAAPLSFNSSQQSFSHADRWAIRRVYLLISAFSFFRVTLKDQMMTGWTRARWCYSRITHQWINCWKSRRHWGISLIYESGAPNISRIYYFQAHITHP